MKSEQGRTRRSKRCYFESTTEFFSNSCGAVSDKAVYKLDTEAILKVRVADVLVVCWGQVLYYLRYTLFVYGILYLPATVRRPTKQQKEEMI